MNSSEITSYAARLDDLRVVTLTDGEVWSARDLMELAGYGAWQDFSNAIDRAIASVNASGLDASEHFRGAPKSSPMPRGGFRQIEDVELTRYGCYILFQNADARKPEIAAAQQYFAVQTRKQELAPVDFDPTSIEGITLILAAAQNALAKVKELEPKADAWDAIASAAGDYSVGDAAKILARAGIPTGPTRLFDQLESIKWTYRGGDGRPRAYAERVDKGYLSEKPSFRYHPGTGDRIVNTPQVRVTVKGIERLRQRLHVGALQAVSGS
ncbi:MAG: hypothetical protein JWM23_590 [Microbacteriaceae bacterium]|nr:hypothetical protein [Microbacteriaceae bacterium]